MNRAAQIIFAEFIIILILINIISSNKKEYGAVLEDYEICLVSYEKAVKSAQYYLRIIESGDPYYGRDALEDTFRVLDDANYGC